MPDQNKTPDTEDYRVSKVASARAIDAPQLDYRPPRPRGPFPKIGLAGCGGIAATHLTVYRDCGFPVVALYDRHPERAKKLQAEFFPDARVCRSEDEFFECDFLIADLTPHPQDRIDLMRRALQNGRHVLSQKPLALDVDVAATMIELARDNGIYLAVNQNGRWAPHVSYARQCIEQGLLGEVQSVDVAIYWDHNWVAGTAFDRVQDLLLYDFAIHWFDMVNCYFKSARPLDVFAQVVRTPTQAAIPPLSGHVVANFALASDAGGPLFHDPNDVRVVREDICRQASFVFRGDSRLSPLDRTIIVGSKGTLVASGPNLNDQSVDLYLAEGHARPKLEGQWFNDGFQGTMGELMCAIEQGRQPSHSASSVLPSLRLCFAAIASSHRNAPVRADSVTRI